MKIVALKGGVIPREVERFANSSRQDERQLLASLMNTITQLLEDLSMQLIGPEAFDRSEAANDPSVRHRPTRLPSALQDILESLLATLEELLGQAAPPARGRTLAPVRRTPRSSLHPLSHSLPRPLPRWASAADVPPSLKRLPRRQEQAPRLTFIALENAFEDLLACFDAPRVGHPARRASELKPLFHTVLDLLETALMRLLEELLQDASARSRE